MTHILKQVPVLAVAAVSIAAANPQSSGSSELSFALTGYVPAICKAQFHGTPVMIDEGRIGLGHLHELCNVEQGYRIILSHPGELRGTLKLGAREIALSETGRTIIVESFLARERTSAAELVLEDGDLPASLSVRVEPSAFLN